MKKAQAIKELQLNGRSVVPGEQVFLEEEQFAALLASGSVEELPMEYPPPPLAAE